MYRRLIYFITLLSFSCSCTRHGSNNSVQPPPPPSSFSLHSFTVNGLFSGYTYHNINTVPVFRFSFNAPLNRNTVTNSLSFRDNTGSIVAYTTVFDQQDSTVIIQPATPLRYLTKYSLTLTTTLKSISGNSLVAGIEVLITTKIDSARKFPLLSDAELLDKVQQQTFKYFWDWAHPVSGMIRERNTSGETVTTGGTGFGIMAIIAGVHRGFITRSQGLERLQTMVAFLKNTAQTFHGAFPHWLNGTTGTVIPFSTKDDGADLVETSFLMQGLLCARQYFNDPGMAETTLRNDINILFNSVEWNWFRNGNQSILYWHWSPHFGWEMNLPIRGWNECLITYVLAAASPTHGIPPVVYTNGWKSGANFFNGNTYYGYSLPLGPPLGGPLFFSHYSFLGINPNGLKEGGINYEWQTKHHALINYNYCKANPQGYFGYSDSVWGLTASDIEGGYTASSPTNDRSVIAPTAALSSFPFTPAESMAALKFFYYVLGDKIWKEYGFVDAFSIHNTWFANSFLAIDQGPIIIMIENYRSGLLWNLFTSCPEVKTGLSSLGFQAPYL